jgi:hypothetical protein
LVGLNDLVWWVFSIELIRFDYDCSVECSAVGNDGQTVFGEIERGADICVLFDELKYHDG